MCSSDLENGSGSIRSTYGSKKALSEAQERLNATHLEYVIDCMRSNTTEIRNIRAYLLTALYNAPVTMSPYYQAAVQHDFSYPQRE